MNASPELTSPTSYRDPDLNDRVVDRREEFSAKWAALFSSEQNYLPADPRDQHRRARLVSSLMEH